MNPDHPDKEAFRQKFLAEHIHSEDEIRFFVRGRGLFVMHVAGKVYSMLCEKDDLISVPANTKHWFDMGPNPTFTAIRLFNNPDGWVAKFSGDPIAERFPLLENR
jgi:1,2-dihydroxy-3-keto-5-methylthiopentene dioxygenase